MSYSHQCKLVFLCTKAVTIRFCGVVESSAYTCVYVALKLDQRTESNNLFLLKVRLLSTSDRLGLGNLTAVHLVNKFLSFINLKDHYRKGTAMGVGGAAIPDGKNEHFKRKKKVICRKLQI